MESKYMGRFIALVDKHRHHEKMALLYDDLVTNYNSIGNGSFRQQSIDKYGTTPRIGDSYYQKELSEAVKSNIQATDDYYKAATKGTNQSEEDNELHNRRQKSKTSYHFQLDVLTDLDMDTSPNLSFGENSYQDIAVKSSEDKDQDDQNTTA